MNNQAMGSGLTRYRSAPSSYFASLLDGPNFGSDDFERLFNPRASSPETQIIFSRFMNSGEAEAPTKTEPCETELQSNDYPLFPQSGDDNNCDSEKTQNKIQRFGTGPNDSPLIRHSSSPAGLFANINIDELGTVRAIGDGNVTEASFCSTSSSSRSRSRTTLKMDPITEIDHNDFPINSWDHHDDFLKGRHDHQKNEGGNPATSRLSHHLSLPKSFGELSSMEKLLQDSVPCKIRAKRGCATHPRSIAERVRRTKISERMRKLQELVPNMEKQTNTSDMLDLAVEYIKDLQEQLKTLSDDREKCSCEAKLRS